MRFSTTKIPEAFGLLEMMGKYEGVFWLRVIGRIGVDYVLLLFSFIVFNILSRSFLKDPPGVGQVPNEPKNLAHLCRGYGGQDGEFLVGGRCWSADLFGWSNFYRVIRKILHQSRTDLSLLSRLPFLRQVIRCRLCKTQGHIVGRQAF